MFSSLLPELLGRIVLLASVDGSGRTAAALRLTSRYVAAVVEPYRFCSMAVEGADRIQSLASAIRDADLQTKSHYRHLLMSDVTKDFRTTLEGLGAPASGNGIFRSAGEAATSSMRDLLALIAPTLVTFILLSYNSSCELQNSVFSADFAQLRHFSAHINGAARREYPAFGINFPMLLSLHVSAGLSMNSEALVSNISAPSLFAIRLGELQLKVSSMLLAYSILGALLPLYSGRIAMSPDAFPNLKLLVVQLFSAEESLEQCYGFTEDMRSWAAYIEDETNRRLEVLVDAPRVTSMTLREEWTDLLGEYT
ncbi:hypothetical protein OE88DRAFT_393583 [Heliocybe sulcata]|uniref:Uncharacterized protein n=1 Tax=Heliocybe sulcata TaxID=5364 RepID=A0A5C3N1F0_9AGAM|nr:hypothetical protein OE88DRAFT_393583 [Heliocybe sulcata]